MTNQNHDQHLDEEELEIEDIQYIHLDDEDGNSVKFEVLFSFEVDETKKKYVFLLNADDETDDEVGAFRVEEHEEGLDFVKITAEDHPDEWDIVEETWNTMMAEEEDEEQ